MSDTATIFLPVWIARQSLCRKYSSRSPMRSGSLIRILIAAGESWVPGPAGRAFLSRCATGSVLSREAETSARLSTAPLGITSEKPPATASHRTCRAAGDRREAPGALMRLPMAMYCRTPVPEAIRRAEQIVERADRRRGAGGESSVPKGRLEEAELTEVSQKLAGFRGCGSANLLAHRLRKDPRPAPSDGRCGYSGARGAGSWTVRILWRVRRWTSRGRPMTSKTRAASSWIWQRFWRSPGRIGEVVPTLEGALALFKRKGNTVSAAKANAGPSSRDASDLHSRAESVREAAPSGRLVCPEPVPC